jgi:transposase
MSTRVSLSQYTCHITQEEDTPVCIRIQRSRATVKALHRRLQPAYQRDAVRLIRRTPVLLALLVPHVPVARLSDRWGRSPSCLYPWRQAFLLRGMDSLVYPHSGGRRPQWTPRQHKRLGELIEAGSLVVGGETACWTAVVLRVLSWRAFGVLYHRQDVCTWRHHLGCAFQKARVVSDHISGWPGFRPSGPRLSGRRHGATAGSSLQRKPALPSGVR